MMGHEARLGLVLGLSVAAWAYPLSVAEAAPQRKDTGPLFTQVDTGQGAAANARALAVKGQCDKALAAFDQALRSTIDMSIRRDRGLCHEALGHPFPAMDDYRAYLAWRPDAPDSDDIRARLDRLELATGTGGPSPNQAQHKSAEDVPDEPALADESAPGTTDNGKRNGIIRRTYDEEERKYRRFDQAMSSPLRRGSGGIFGVYSDFRDWSANSTNIFNVEVGANIRWSFDQFNAVYGQIGYVDYDPNAFNNLLSGIEQPNFGGLALGLGYEFRLRLDENATHSLLFGALVEYQRLAESTTNVTLNLLIPGGKLGYRAILGYGFGLEVAFDLGAPIVLNSPVTAEGVDVGGTFAVSLAF